MAIVMVLAIPLGDTFSSEVIIFVLAAALLYTIFRLGKGLFRLVLAILINSALGIVALFLLNRLFGVEIPVVIATLVPTAIFGLPAVGSMVLLKALGIPL